MHEAQLIDYYSPPGIDVKAAAEQVRGRVPQIRGLANQVEKDHKGALDAVAGQLEASIADAPRIAVTKADNTLRVAEFAAGCLELFSQAIDQHNDTKSDRPRSVSKLNADYNQAMGDSFGVDYQDPGANATQAQKDKAHTDYLDAYQAARNAKIAELRQEANGLDGWLDGKAGDVSRMIDRGPNEADVRMLWAAGALSPYAVLAFPGAGLSKITLSAAAQQELLEDLIAHPELLIAMPPALKAVVDNLPSDTRTKVYVEQRMAHLRQQGLLTGPNPGVKYEQWIENTYLNGVPISIVIDIARTHDIRPDDFNVLNGLKEIEDRDQKSFFLLPTDISGDDAKKAVLMTYILNAGTDYGANGERTDFTPEPYNAAEIQRIIDRQNGNAWSYRDDVDFVHDHGGRLVTTPNGMLMGIGGVDAFSQDGGTTWGDIFMINDNPPDPDQRLEAIVQTGERPSGGLDLDRLLHHEERHSRQWDREWAPWYGLRYVTWESMFGLKEGWSNAYEQDAGLTDGGYPLPPPPNPTPGPAPTPQPTPQPTPEPPPTPSPTPGPSPTPR